MSCRKIVARSVEGVKCHQALGSSDLVGRRIPAFHSRAFNISTIAWTCSLDGVSTAEGEVGAEEVDQEEVITEEEDQGEKGI